MLYVCVRGVMDVVFSVCIVTHGAVGVLYRKYEFFVMQMLYVCVLCASCGSSQCCILHDLHHSLNTLILIHHCHHFPPPSCSLNSRQTSSATPFVCVYTRTCS